MVALRVLFSFAALPAVIGSESSEFLPHGHRLHLGRIHAPTKQAALPQKASFVGLKKIPIEEDAASPMKVAILKPDLAAEVSPTSPVLADGVANVVADDKSSTVTKMEEQLAEMEQRRTHIKQLEQTLKTDASLLRESTVLEKVSKSQRGHEIALRQVKDAAQLVKSTEEMLHESRQEAIESSRDMKIEAAAVRSAADSLGAEAKEQLKMFGKTSEQATVAAPQTPPAQAQVLATKVTSKSDDVDDLDIEDEN